MRKTVVVTLLLVVLTALLAAPLFAAESAAPVQSASDAPVAQADPACPGSLVNTLTVGETGIVARQFSSLRNAPGGAAFRFLPGGSVFTVIGGPTCVNDLWYIQVDYGNGLTGWANESQVSSQYGQNLYWLEEHTVTPTNTPVPTDPCGASLPTQLTLGGQGQIAQRFSTLRTAPPALAGVRNVFSPATFDVVGGPECFGGLVYWEITYLDGPAAGQTGWANESQRTSSYGIDQYWLEPLAPAS